MAISISATSTVFDRELAVAGAVQLAVLGVVSAAVGLSPLGWVAGLVFALVTGLLLVRHDAAGRALAAGAANQVTLARATLVGGVTALVAAGASGPQLVGAGRDRRGGASRSTASTATSPAATTPCRCWARGSTWRSTRSSSWC